MKELLGKSNINNHVIKRNVKGKEFELIEIIDGKYYVKFPFLDIPVEMSEDYFNSIQGN